MIIDGILTFFLGGLILYLNGPTMHLFSVVEELCKSTNDQYGGTDITTTFVHVSIQAGFSLVIGFCLAMAAIFSILGLGNLNLKLLKFSIIFWIFAFTCLFCFLVYSAVATIDVNESYMYCYLSVLIDRLQKGIDTDDKVMKLIGDTEIFLNCCGVRGPADYRFYSELFGTDRYPRSCCYSNKLNSYNCKEKYIQKKVGCYKGIRTGINNRKSLFTFAIVFPLIFMAPLMFSLHWIMQNMTRHVYLSNDEMENISEGFGDGSVVKKE